MRNIYLSMKCRIILTLSGILTGCLMNAYAQTMIARPFSHPDIHGYYEYLPAGYASTSGRFPLLIALHGKDDGGNGTTDLSKVLRHGIPPYIANGTMPKNFTVNGQTFSFIMLFPQTAGPATADDMRDFINYARTKYRVDSLRIYLTGLSMGGGGTETYASASDSTAKTLAAIVPICSVFDPMTDPEAPDVVARNSLAFWAFHNENDPVVPSAYSKNWVSMINSYLPTPNPLAKLTIFDTTAHDAWTRAYNPNYRENGRNIYEWMLQNTRNLPPTARVFGNTYLTLPLNYVDLDGSGSVDRDGSIVKYQWTQLSGPAGVMIDSPEVCSTRVRNFVQPGDYTFQLTVTDNRNATTRVISYIKVQGSGATTPTLTVYPNPVQNTLNFKVTGMSKTVTNIQAKIYGMNGTLPRFIFYPISGDLVKSIDVSQLPPGTYLFEVQEGNNMYVGATLVKMFIKL